MAQVVHLDPTTGKQGPGTGVAICTQVDADGSLFDCQGADVFPGGEHAKRRFTIGKTWTSRSSAAAAAMMAHRARSTAPGPTRNSPYARATSSRLERMIARRGINSRGRRY